MLFWLALTVALLLLAGSVLYITVTGLAVFRDFKRLGRSVAAGIERIETSSGRNEAHLARAAESGSRLDGELAELRRSRARLNVLTSALADARASVGRITAVYPRK